MNWLNEILKKLYSIIALHECAVSGNTPALKRGLSLSFFSGGTTWLQEKHPVCTNSVLSSVQAFMGLSHAAFGNHHLMQEVSVLIDGAMIDDEALTPCAH